MKPFIKKSLTILRHTVSILVPMCIVAGAAYAGSLTPSTGTPSGTGYTLGDIYVRLTTNATSTEGGHDISTSSSPLPTFHTLTEIYNAIPTILPADLLVGKTYLGVTGTALANQFNGTCHYTEAGHENCPLGTESVGGSQSNGGIDDYNGYAMGGTPSSNRYTTSWTTCTAGNSYCGTGDSGANAKDEATGLIWSYPCHGSGCSSWDTTDSATLTTGCPSTCAYRTTDTSYSWDNSGASNGGKTTPNLCPLGWALPHQKQLMQAYIDGSYGNLEPVGVSRYYWSATRTSYDLNSAWYIGFSDGVSTSIPNSYAYYTVRCVKVELPQDS